MPHPPRASRSQNGFRVGFSRSVGEESGGGNHEKESSIGPYLANTDDANRTDRMEIGVPTLNQFNNQSCNAPPCTCNTLPCNNWIDNAGAMDTSRFIGGMSSLYSVPGTPVKGDTPGQTLFYFIGAENTNG